MNSVNALPAPRETLVTKSHHHVLSNSDPAITERTTRGAERPLCTARAPPMNAPATTGMLRELTVRRRSAASGPCLSKRLLLYSSPPLALIALDYLGR